MHLLFSILNYISQRHSCSIVFASSARPALIMTSTQAHPVERYASLEQAAAACNNFEQWKDKIGYYQLHLEGRPGVFGTPHPAIAADLKALPGWKVDEDGKVITLLGANELEYSSTLSQTLQHLRSRGKYPVLNNWRDEYEAMYGPDGKHIATCPRSGTPLLGSLSYGVHMTAYFYKDGQMKIWVARRAPRKHSYPNMLDNTVGGCISLSSDGLLLSAESVLFKESGEEASLRPADMEGKFKLVSVIHYGHVRTRPVMPDQTEADYLAQWDVLYNYDLELGPETEVRPNDEEVHEFVVMTPDECKEAIYERRFKPNSAVVLLEFLHRHGFVDEREYEGVEEHLRAKLPGQVSAEARRLSEPFGNRF